MESLETVQLIPGFVDIPLPPSWWIRSSYFFNWVLHSSSGSFLFFSALGSALGVLPVNRLQTYIHRCRPTQAPCGLQSHETSRVSTHCTLKSKAACLRLFGFRLGEKRCACVFHLRCLALKTLCHFQVWQVWWSAIVFKIRSSTKMTFWLKSKMAGRAWTL